MKAGVEFKNDLVFTRSSLDFFKGPTVSADAVVGTQGLFAGAEVGYDVADAKVIKYGAAFGYIEPLFSATVSM